MILDLLWAAAIVGGLAAVVQMIRHRHLDLRPLVFGCLALVVLVGLLGSGWQGAQAMQLWAHSYGSHAHPDPAALDAHAAAVLALLGGIAVWVRAAAARRLA